MNGIKNYTSQVRPIEHDGETIFEASFKEFGDSLSVFGKTPAEALQELYRQGEEIVDEHVKAGIKLPTPCPESLPEWISFSGKLTIRVAKSLHCELSNFAHMEGQSLNSLISTILTEGCERRRHLSQITHLPAYIQVMDIRPEKILGTRTKLPQVSNSFYQSIMSLEA